MRVVLFGATGMIGSGALIECLEDDRVESVLAVGRRPTGRTHPKLREHIRSDFFHYDDAAAELSGFDACFFCLGTSAAGKSEPDYHRLTYDLTISAARVLGDLNPGLTFCYVSGQGTDSSERGRSMWARVKGKTENELLRMPFRAYVFRPGFVQPMKGVHSSTPLYAAAYAVLSPAYPLLKRLFPRHVTTSVNLGRAMIHVALDGYDRHVLENDDINELAQRDGKARPG